jgi:hypothetical protein
MKLRVIKFDEVASELAASDRPVAIILAPNFESRSISVCEQLVRNLHRRKILQKRVHWFVLTLQGTHPPEILDALKAIHTRAVLSVLRKSGYDGDQVIHRMIPYPPASRRPSPPAVPL